MSDEGQTRTQAVASDIARELRARIVSGEFEQGRRLPGRRALMEEYGAADRTVALALHQLRVEGLVYALQGSGWYVRTQRAIVRSNRNRLSASERAAGRGTFSTDCEAAGLQPDIATDTEVQAATEDVAMDLGLEAGAEVFVRSRVMRGGQAVLQLATSYLPRSLTIGTQIEEADTGPGGIYARLEDLGHRLTRFVETVAIGRATDAEARQMEITPGDAIYRVVRVAYSTDRPVEINHITITGDRYELVYDLSAG